MAVPIADPTGVQPNPKNRLASRDKRYDAFLRELKGRIQRVQLRAALAANCELVLLYWDIGRGILVRQRREGWGAQVIDRLAHDLRAAFPDLHGFSPRNLKYMRAFAVAWPDRQFVQQVVAQIPWGHSVRILDSVTDPPVREWYVRQSLIHGVVARDSRTSSRESSPREEGKGHYQF